MSTVVASSLRPPTSARALRRARAQALGLCLQVALLTGLWGTPLAWAGYPGQGLLEFSRNYLIAPIGLFAVCLSLAASVIRPDLVRGALYTGLICAVLFFLIGQAGAVMAALQ